MSRPQIFVKGYPIQTTQKDLEEFFDRIGKVQQIRLMSHFAFVTFSNMHYAEKAVEKCHTKRFNGKNLLVQIARQSNRRRDDTSVVDKNVCFLCKKEGHWKINCPEFKSKIDPHVPRRWRRRQDESESNERNYKSRRHSTQSQSEQKKKKSKHRRQKEKSYSKNQSSVQNSGKSHNRSQSSSSSEQKRDRKKSKGKKHKSSRSHKKSKSHRKDHKSKSKHHSKKHSKKRNYSSSHSSQKQSLSSSQASKRSSSAASEKKNKYSKKVNQDQKLDNNASKYYQQKKIDIQIGQKTRTPEKKKEKNFSVSKSNS